MSAKVLLALAGASGPVVEFPGGGLRDGDAPARELVDEFSAARAGHLGGCGLRQLAP
jgi:hypothetical protein